MSIDEVKVVFDREKPCTQEEFGNLIGVTQQAVSDLKRRGVIAEGLPLGEWLRLYCAHLAKIGTERAEGGELDLATERARLAKVQRERIEMQNDATRAEIGPIAELEEGLSVCMALVSAKLAEIPNRLGQAVGTLTADDLSLVAGVIADIRHDINGIEIDWFDEKNGEEDDE